MVEDAGQNILCWLGVLMWTCLMVVNAPVTNSVHRSSEGKTVSIAGVVKNYGLLGWWAMGGNNCMHILQVVML